MKWIGLLKKRARTITLDSDSGDGGEVYSEWPQERTTRILRRREGVALIREAGRR